jgi:HAE1 family hydrophobic/amphiphilic exporter-1
VIGSINREDQRYSMQVNWEYVGTDRMRQKFLNDILDGIELPYGYTAEDVSGERMTEDEEEEMKQLLWLTVLFIFMALAALFESFTLPLLVLLSIPMALCGVVGLFWATDSAFDSSAKIGLVLLFGIVVNNAILLINRFRLQVRELVAEKGYTDEQVPAKRRLGGVDLWRLDGNERKDLLKEAICGGTRIQLRSILLVSGTTIAGLLPLLIKITDTSEGKDIWENLALTSIGGLASSTVLIISAIPAIYWIMTRFGWALARVWAWLRRRGITPAPVPESSGSSPS